MEYPNNLKYAKTHEWVLEQAGTAKVGLTDFAQHELGDIVFVNLPSVGDSVSVGEAFGDVESVKAVSDIFSPLSGTVVAINEEVLTAPEFINSDPYGTWLIEVGDICETEQLLDAAQYEQVCKEEA